MRYLLCFVCPPVAVLLCAKPVTALLNVLLCCLFIVPGVVHALIVVSSHKADVRMKKQTKAITGAIRQNQAAE